VYLHFPSSIALRHDVFAVVEMSEEIQHRVCAVSANILRRLEIFIPLDELERTYADRSASNQKAFESLLLIKQKAGFST